MAEINGIKIQTSHQVVPKIYAYTTPEIKRHLGWTKIGYTEQNDVQERIRQQTYTADIIAKYEWSGNAIFENSNKRFTDKQFHAYLRNQGIEQEQKKEWFHIEPMDAKYQFYSFRENQGVLKKITDTIPYSLRPEQQEAVKMTIEYYLNNKNGEFLWNCKPRFGKTLSVYDFCKQIEAKNILIVTNRPAISNSWYSDYENFLGTNSGYYFVSEDSNLKGKSLVLSREKYDDFLYNNKHLDPKCIEFVSLQDLKGSIYFGGSYNKLKHIKLKRWDILVIDEAHEGIDTYKTDRAFDNIHRDFTLHLSGTPFKALANDKFPSNATYNWTYADEQRAKEEWKSENENPYISMPKLNLFTYQMSDIVQNKVKRGLDLDDNTIEFAFDLNEFFATKDSGMFIHNDAIDKFLDALTTQKKFPFSTAELRDELKHTFWLLNRVDSAKALASKLKKHPVFKEYEIILAAGDGKLSEYDETQNTKSYSKVMQAIERSEKTITLSVGQLTTGVTIPEWTAVLMLSNMQSPSLYLQAAFRAQNPKLFEYNGGYRRKENAYIFDFDPARTLNIFEKFANDLSSNTVQGKGTKEYHEMNIRELLNFFPVYAEDDEGNMIELDAKQVLKIPRKIRSLEVVRHGFMSNFLFQNVSTVFGAPKVVVDILSQMTPSTEQRSKNTNTNLSDASDITVDSEGEVVVDEKIIIGKAQDLFGDKVYETYTVESVNEIISNTVTTNSFDRIDEISQEIKQIVETTMIAPMVEKAQESLGQQLRKSELNQLNSSLNKKIENIIQACVGDFNQETKILDVKKIEELDNCSTEEEERVIIQTFEELKKDIAQKMHCSINESLSNFVKNAGEETVEKVEVAKQEEKKRTIEDDVKERLRGFTRTIPSFLMAYGEQDVTLFNFDTIIPNDVFYAVTGITLEQFRFLRDGDDYKDEETGEIKHFNGNIFDALVFNDSITEFMKLKDRLANYFEESNSEDIFDYIPPQKTNQIFTPKKIVKKMVDMLEEENPGCFDDPNATFADLYMKSGLYITEIVKKLYNSPKISKIFPNRDDRLKHIFKNQVFGLAPNEIIYKISINFILGFDKHLLIKNHNFRQVDALIYAEEGNLDEKLDAIFGEINDREVKERK